MFVSWCANECGYIEDGIIPKYAGCVNGVQWFKDREQWVEGNEEPVPGMIIFFDWDDPGGDNGPQEKELAFPWDIRFELRLRSGVPVLFRFLMENSYDIWLYSAQYYSFDTLQEFFRKYHVEVTGLVCRKKPAVRGGQRRPRAHDHGEIRLHRPY